MSERVTNDNATPARMTPALLERRIRTGKCRVAEDGTIERKCPRCNEYWPADSEFFYVRKKGDGLTDWCKACYVEWRFPEGRGSVGHKFHERTA